MYRLIFFFFFFLRGGGGGGVGFAGCTCNIERNNVCCITVCIALLYKSSCKQTCTESKLVYKSLWYSEM